MFYLKSFFNVLFKHSFRGILFFLLTALCVFSLGHKSQLEPFLGSWNSTPEEGAYFYALISTKENLSEIRSKLAMLPGVAGVKEVSSEQIATEVRALLGSTDVTPQMLGFDYQGIKLSFESGLKPESRVLIREFLTRLCMEGNLLMGGVREVQSQTSPVVGWQKWILNFWSIWALVMIFWFFSFVSLLHPLREYSYLIEKFQRRQRVAFKSACVGIFFCVVLVALLTLIWWPVDYFLLPFALLMPLLALLSGLRKFVWGT